MKSHQTSKAFTFWTHEKTQQHTAERLLNGRARWMEKEEEEATKEMGTGHNSMNWNISLLKVEEEYMTEKHIGLQ